jgi:hypothetical protein
MKMHEHRVYKSLRNKAGQGTVEAVFVIPILLLLFLMLLQPGICLYNLMVMQNAAAEGCRLLATRTEQGNYSADKYEGYIKRRLAAIPPVGIFHVSDDDTAWQLELSGNENSPSTSVRIVNQLKPLPLIGWGAELSGMTNERGYIEQSVEVTMPTQPDWVWKNSKGSPGEWVGQWN